MNKDNTDNTDLLMKLTALPLQSLLFTPPPLQSSEMVLLLEELVDVPYSSTVIPTIDMPVQRSAVLITERDLHHIVSSTAFRRFWNIHSIMYCCCSLCRLCRLCPEISNQLLISLITRSPCSWKCWVRVSSSRKRRKCQQLRSLSFQETRPGNNYT